MSALDTAAADERVFLRPDLLAPMVLRFVEASALRDCTKVEQHPNGWAAITPRWPVGGWSTGEKVLWRLLASLTDGDLQTAFNRLDTRSLRALVGLFDSMGAVVS